jgi:hypothetical protein
MARGLVPKERFLEWSVEDGWEPLCHFLGKEVPTTTFPNGNTPAAFIKIIEDNHGKWITDAYWNMALVAESLVAGTSLVTFRKEVVAMVLDTWVYGKSAIHDDLVAS